MKVLSLLVVALALTVNVARADWDWWHITPICECVVDLGNGYYEVCLNFQNNWGGHLTLPWGSTNRFSCSGGYNPSNNPEQDFDYPDNIPGRPGRSNFFPVCFTRVKFPKHTVFNWWLGLFSCQASSSTPICPGSDNTPPVLTPPANVKINADAGSAFGTVPSPFAATATDPDNSPSSITICNTEFKSASGTCTADASGKYPIGTTNVTWTATDSAGNAAQAVWATVTVVDNQPPTFTDSLCGSSCASSGCVVTATIDPTTYPNCATAPVTTAPISLVVTGHDNSGTWTITSNANGGGASASGQYPIGNTPLTFSISDSVNTVQCHVNVQVTNLCPPVFTNPSPCPVTVQHNTDQGQPFATVSIPGVTVKSNVGGITVVNDFDNSGGAGITNGQFAWPSRCVTFTAQDQSSPHPNQAQCAYTVVVIDNQPPTFNVPCPYVVTVGTDPDANSYTVPAGAIPLPVASDNVGVVSFQEDNATPVPFDGQVLSLNPVDGTSFTYKHVFSAADAHPNTATCEVDIVVQDAQDPVLDNCPNGVASLSVPVATGGATGTGSFSLQAHDNSGFYTVTNDYVNSCSSGASLTACSFTYGQTTTITFTVTDPSNRSVQCVLTVTVSDPATDVPTFASCSDQTFSTGPASPPLAVTVLAPSATDGLDVISPTVVAANPALPAAFPIGPTSVTYVATNAAGHQASCTFNVIIKDTGAPTLSYTVSTVNGVAPSSGQATFNLVPDANANTVAVTVAALVADNVDSPANIQVSIAVTTNGVTSTTTGASASLSLGEATTNQVTITATDSSNNQNSATFTIVVGDTCSAITCNAGTCQVTTLSPYFQCNCDPTKPFNGQFCDKPILAPEAAISAPTTSVKQGDSLTISDASTTFAAITSRVWTVSPTGAAGSSIVDGLVAAANSGAATSITFASMPVVTQYVDQTYTFTLQLTDVYGQQSAQVGSITIFVTATPYVPPPPTPKCTSPPTVAITSVGPLPNPLLRCSGPFQIQVLPSKPSDSSPTTTCNYAINSYAWTATDTTTNQNVVFTTGWTTSTVTVNKYDPALTAGHSYTLSVVVTLWDLNDNNNPIPVSASGFTFTLGFSTPKAFLPGNGAAKRFIAPWDDEWQNEWDDSGPWPTDFPDCKRRTYTSSLGSYYVPEPQSVIFLQNRWCNHSAPRMDLPNIPHPANPPYVTPGSVASMPLKAACGATDPAGVVPVPDLTDPDYPNDYSHLTIAFRCVQDFVISHSVGQDAGTCPDIASLNAPSPADGGTGATTFQALANPNKPFDPDLNPIVTWTQPSDAWLASQASQGLPPSIIIPACKLEEFTRYFFQVYIARRDTAPSPSTVVVSAINLNAQNTDRAGAWTAAQGQYMTVMSVTAIPEGTPPNLFQTGLYCSDETWGLTHEPECANVCNQKAFYCNNTHACNDYYILDPNYHHTLFDCSTPSSTDFSVMAAASPSLPTFTCTWEEVAGKVDLSGVTSCTLLFDPQDPRLKPNTWYSFCNTVTITETGYSRRACTTMFTTYDPPVSDAPASASFVVSPTTGTALSTQFLLQMQGWRCPTSRVSYSFNYILQGSNEEIPLVASSMSATQIVVLPAGVSQIVAYAWNQDGTSARVVQSVTVNAPAANDPRCAILSAVDTLNQALQAGNQQLALQLLNSIGQQAASAPSGSLTCNGADRTADWQGLRSQLLADLASLSTSANLVDPTTTAVIATAYGSISTNLPAGSSNDDSSSLSIADALITNMNVSSNIVAAKSAVQGVLNSLSSLVTCSSLDDVTARIIAAVQAVTANFVPNQEVYFSTPKFDVFLSVGDLWSDVDVTIPGAAPFKLTIPSTAFPDESDTVFVLRFTASGALQSCRSAGPSSTGLRVHAATANSVSGSLATPITDVQIWRQNNQVASVTGLTTPITMTFNEAVAASCAAEATCVFWDTTSSTWSSAGCTTDFSASSVTCQCNHLTEFAVITNGNACTTASNVNGGYVFVFVAYLVLAVLTIAAGAVRARSGPKRETAVVSGLIVLAFVARMIAAFSFSGVGSVSTIGAHVLTVVPFIVYFFVNMRLVERARLATQVESPLRYSLVSTSVLMLMVTGAVAVGLVSGFSFSPSVSDNVMRALAAVSAVSSLAFLAHAVFGPKPNNVLSRTCVLTSVTALACSVAWLVWASQGAAVAAFLLFDAAWCATLLNYGRAGAAKEAPAVPTKASADLPTPPASVTAA